MRLKEKVAIITGAGSGMGATEAKLFIKNGAKVIATDINEAGLNKLKAEVESVGGSILTFKHDVTSEEGWKDVIKKGIEEYGKIDILVNNAGIASDKLLPEITMDEWNLIMNINLNGSVLGMKYVIPEMQKNGSGSVINTSSIGGIVGISGTTAYSASKGALRVLSKSAAVEYGKDSIRVNSVHPGIIITPMTAPGIKDRKAFFETHTQLPYLGESEDVANGVLFLASDESKFITGTELVIDGGWTAF